MSGAIAAVIDTNVILDLYSLADLLRANEEGTAIKHESRRSRARDALLLAWSLHAECASTLSLGDEATRRVKALNEPSILSTTGHHMQMSIWFLKERVLRNWDDRAKHEGDIRGGACDDALLALALENHCPLVTNEGVKTDGSVDDSHGLRSKARSAGAVVFSPREFWTSRQNESEATTAILSQIDQCAVGFVVEQRFSAAGCNAVIARRAFARYVLLGETVSSTEIPSAPWLLSPR